MASRYPNPRSRAEWQEAVDSAQGALALESARLYGLVTGGPVVNVDRCEEIISKGKQRKIFPSHDAIERFVRSILKAGSAESQE